MRPADCLGVPPFEASLSVTTSNETRGVAVPRAVRVLAVDHLLRADLDNQPSNAAIRAGNGPIAVTRVDVRRAAILRFGDNPGSGVAGADS